jgi:hypothetical protein
VELNEILTQIDEWAVDSFRINDLTSNQPLVYTSFVLFHKYNLFERLSISQDKFLSFVTALQSAYHMGNPYHNRTHAADVTLSTNYFLTTGGLHSHLTDLDVVASLFSAMIHDADHPGYGNSYEINSGSERAITYNDLSPLENHHLAGVLHAISLPFDQT